MTAARHPSAQAWPGLQARAAAEAARPIAALMAEPGRFEDFSLEAGALFLDYSKNAMSWAARAELLALLEASGFAERRAALLAGEPVNRSEGRPALHAALRGGAAAGMRAIAEAVDAELDRLGAFAEGVRAGRIKGATGERYTDVVNIGIGGSLLGPHMAVRALGRYAAPGLRCHFVSDPDGCKLRELMAGLNPATTLFILASKTFTTAETLANAALARAWLAAALGARAGEHLVGVSSAPARMSEYGIAPERQFRLWDWVGGRYSVWSAVGLALALAVGMDHFRAFLAGAALMDRHFAHAEPARNMPVLLALSHVWHTTFRGASAVVNLPYQQRLKFLPAYLQQLEMESLGKRVDHAGRPVGYATGALVFGQVGNNAQHSFMQLLHQGTADLLVDFIAVADDADAPERLGLANCLAQSRALMLGTAAGLDAEPHRICPGNRPSNTLVLARLDPGALGQLLALYEHKVFVQSVLWNINAYDQWGVELGKRIATEVHATLRDGTGLHALDASTAGLLRRLRG